MSDQNHKPIAIWLLCICALIFAMILLGGVTRLTESGLSMVEWKPVVGWIPPMNETEWQDQFQKYQQSPEYQKKNIGMSLDQFKSIFYFEFSHRVLGRLIGLAFLLPFLYFLIRRKIPRALTPQMIIMFILGGLQGVLGWYMVKSGLVNDPRVSQYRLTAHLISAITIYCYILWVALGLLKPSSSRQTVTIHPENKFSIFVTALIVLQIISGGFVAGTDAGLAYNTFPLMGDKFIPDGLMTIQPAIMNLFENIVTIQFNHRMIAYLLIIIIPIFWFKMQRSDASAKTKQLSHLLLVMLVIQVTLGISTLLMHVPVSIASIHQGGGLVLLTLSLLINHALSKSQASYDPDQSTAV